MLFYDLMNQDEIQKFHFLFRLDMNAKMHRHAAIQNMTPRSIQKNQFKKQ